MCNIHYIYERRVFCRCFFQEQIVVERVGLFLTHWGIFAHKSCANASLNSFMVYYHYAHSESRDG
jgi:hypothetical protein